MKQLKELNNKLMLKYTWNQTEKTKLEGQFRPIIARFHTKVNISSHCVFAVVCVVPESSCVFPILSYLLALISHMM